MPQLSPRVAVAAVIATLLVAGVWPYHEILDWMPWGADTSKWVGNGTLDNPRWWRWSTGQKHFVGYRPVTALSFVGNWMISGYAAFGYRVTDLGLHLATGALLFWVYRRLTGDRSAIGLLPVVVLFGHPATEEIVPFVARRSYLLALAFGLGALASWLEALDPTRRRWPWAVLTALLLGLAVLSNEIAYVLVPLLPLLVFTRTRDLWLRSLARLAPTAITIGLAIAARYQVLGTFGGYQKRYFAFVHNGTPMWRELIDWQPWRIASACWLYTFDPNGVAGAEAPIVGQAGLGFAAMVSAWILWFGVVRPLLRFREPEQRVPLVLSAWLFGGVAIVVLSQTWFWRQTHGLLAPLGMLIAIGVRSTVEDLRGRWALQVPSFAIAVAAVGVMCWNGPLWTGLDRAPHLNAIEGTPVVRQVRELLRQVDGPATVYLVAPMRASAAHIVRLWGDHYGRKKRIDFRLIGHLRQNATQSVAKLELRRNQDPPELFLRSGFTFSGGTALVSLKTARNLPIDRLWRPGGRPAWLFAIDADEGWAIRIPKPPQGVEVIPDAPEPELPEDEDLGEPPGG